MVHATLAPRLAFRTERGVVLVPPGLLSLSRYPRHAVELPLPQAEEAMIAGPNGTRFGFRGRVTIEVRPEEWRKTYEASPDLGLKGVVVAAAREAGGRVLSPAAADSPGMRRPALAREFEERFTEELGRRGVLLKRLDFASIDYLSVPAGSEITPAPDVKLLIVGLDGADWAVIDPLLAADAEPARLIEKGTRCPPSA